MKPRVIKIVITGPFACGKTTFVESLSEVVPVVTDVGLRSFFEKSIKRFTTVALDYGRIKVDEDLIVHLFGTPGQLRFSFMWRILARGMHGYILMVDSSRPESIEDALYVYNFFKSIKDVPHIIAANKQDIEGSLSPKTIRFMMKIPNDVPVVPLVATDPENVRKTLTILVQHMIKWYSIKQKHVIRK